MRIYGSRQVGPGQRPTPSLGRVQDTTAPFARGVSDLGRGVAQGAAQIDAALQRREDAKQNLEYQRAVNQAYVAASQLERQFDELEGEAAVGQADLFVEEYRQTLDGIREGLTGRARENFDVRIPRFEEDFTKYAVRREAREEAKYRGDNVKLDVARSLEATQDPSASYDDLIKALDVPFRIPGTDEEGNIVFAPGLLASELIRRGVSKGVADKIREDHFAQGLSNAVRARMLAEDFDGAEEILERAVEDGFIRGRAAQDLRNQLLEQRQQLEAKSIVFDLMNKSRNIGGPEAAEDERYVRPEYVRQEILKIEDHQLRERVLQAWNAHSAIATSEFNILSSEKYQAAWSQGHSEHDNSWHKSRLSSDGLEALEWLRKHDQPKYEALMARHAQTNAAWRARTEAERSARLGVAKAEFERESSRVKAQIQLDMARNPDKYLYTPETGEEGIRAMFSEHEARLTNKHYEDLTKEVVKFNEPKTQEFVRRISSHVGELPQYMLLGGQKARIEAAMRRKLFDWMDENPGETPDAAWIDTNLTKTLSELGIQVTGEGAGTTRTLPTLSDVFTAAISPRGPGFAVLTEPADPIKLTPEAAYDLGAREYQKRLRQPLPVEQAIRDPVTGRIDPRRQSAVRALQAVGEPITELNLLYMLGEE